MVTYNHEQFIAKALDSVLSQEHNYSYEIIVGDDCSTDDTRNILLEYERRYPEIIRLILQPRNMGASSNSLKTLEACKGEYVALLEGDDYWNNNQKLKQQVEFLDKNTSYVLSSHRYLHYLANEDRFNTDHEYHGLFDTYPEGVRLDHDLFFNYWFTMPLTVVFRNDVFEIGEVSIYKDFKDLHLFFCLLKKGDGFVHNFVGGVYNTHKAGVWSQLDAYGKWKANYLALHELVANNVTHARLRKACADCLNLLVNVFKDTYKYPYLHREMYWLMSRRLSMKK